MWTPFAVVFFCAEMPSVGAVFSIYSLNDVRSGYVCCSWMRLDARECFLLNFKPFSVNDSLGERICVFSVGNVKLIFQNWFTLSMPRPSSSLIHARRLKSKLRVWFAATHYFESEITSLLPISKYIVLT